MDDHKTKTRVTRIRYLLDLFDGGRSVSREALNAASKRNIDVGLCNDLHDGMCTKP
ncbi:hypothetical protein D3C80_1933090 [compost metagenome]